MREVSRHSTTSVEVPVTATLERFHDTRSRESRPHSEQARIRQNHPIYTCCQLLTHNPRAVRSLHIKRTFGLRKIIMNHSPLTRRRTVAHDSDQKHTVAAAHWWNVRQRTALPRLPAPLNETESPEHRASNSPGTYVLELLWLTQSITAVCLPTST